MKSTPSPWITRYGKAYAACRPTIEALAPEQGRAVDVDIFQAASIALTALPQMRLLRPLLSALRGFDLAKFDRIEDYSLALVHIECERRAVERADSSIVEQEARRYDAELALVIRTLPPEATAPAALKPPENAVERALETLRHAQRARPVLEKLLLEEHERRDDLYSLLDAEFQAELVLAMARHERADASLHARFSAERERAFALFAEAYEGSRPGVKYLLEHKDQLDQLAFRYAQKRAGEQLAELINTAPSTGGDPWGNN